MFLMLERVRSIEGWGDEVYNIEDGLDDEFWIEIEYFICFGVGDITCIPRLRDAPHNRIRY